MARQRSPVVTAVLVLLVAWLVLVIVGLLFKALFYLTVIAVVAIIATLAWGGYQAGRRSRR